MAHLNSDTLNVFKSIHHDIHHLLKRYHEEQTVTDEELVEELESIKAVSASMIDNWNQHLNDE